MESYMTVESVLRYLGKNALALKQYKIGEQPNHFFKSTDVEAKMGKSEFRIMECEVTQFWVKNPK